MTLMVFIDVVAPDARLAQKALIHKPVQVYRRRLPVNAEINEVFDPDIHFFEDNIHRVLQRFKLTLDRSQISFVGILGQQRADALDNFQRLFRRLFEGAKHELDDRFIAPGLPGGTQKLIIPVFVPDDVGACIQNWGIQIAFLAEKQDVQTVLPVADGSGCRRRFILIKSIAQEFNYRKIFMCRYFSFISTYLLF